MDDDDIIFRLAVSLSIGLLVGLERGWRSRAGGDHQRAAGLRTFALSGLLGGVTGVLALETGYGVIGFVFIGFAAIFAGFHWLQANATRNWSVTSCVAGLLTFLLGVMAVTGEMRVAVACAVAMTLLLALRERLHSLVASLSWEEIRAVLTLLAMSFLLLPFLPNRTVDPWGTINPYEIWLLAILIAAISFAGYVAVKAFGNRLGVLMTALAGGLASSTATTLAFARLAAEHPASSRLLSAGILISGLVMLVRVGVVAVALNGALLPDLVPPLLAAAVILAIGAGVMLAGGGSAADGPELKIDNPLAIGTALKLTAFIAFVSLASELLRRAFGSVGVMVVAALSGLADVDAVTLSMARMAGSGIDLMTATWAILIAVAVNTLSKAVMSGWIGGRAVGLLVGGVSLLALAAGLLTARML
ncbi:MAG: MgtC/SapB family protein [Alphaproteobacteria bacterium]|nr:MgtC/SapB family protein [Alphaproteobacteria bacterium]MBU0798800.1 MgtC/SapB family protein [Alphaproteobacteria bacterium]MBU0886063.1 MgtC/SapB family protein [Alphaproteobacteria bacterium]MBU1812052.1 MgtC/SapB family protein [Alphaproteobacteria bacterium]